MAENPTAFISYSYDSTLHTNKVLEFSNKLRSEGIDAILDQYVECPPEGWPRWMDKQISQSDFVLMICTKSYCDRVMGIEKKGMGHGARWEGHLIYQYLYSAGALNTKFIPILFDDGKFEYIPTPLQATTVYKVENSVEYEKLYWRLLGLQKTSKPPLGKLKPLPQETRKGIFLTSFIDVGLWNKARWCGTVFASDVEMKEPPYFGFQFTEEKAAEKIFEGWHNRFGNVDKFNELRISIIEGKIKNKSPGYTVFVSANPENIYERAEYEDLDIPSDYTMVIGRMHRMTPAVDSINLQRFKQHFQKVKSCYLVPAFMSPEGLVIREDLKLLKQEMLFRNTDEIRAGGCLDLDWPVLGEPLPD